MKTKNFLTSFDYTQAPDTAVLLKSNFLVDLEDYRDSSSRFELTRMEWMLIQTAFYMTQKIKEKHGDYLFSADTEFSISFKNFCELWKIKDVKKKQEDGSLYREITRALKQVMAMQFNYPRIDTGEMALSGYFSEISYSNQRFTFSIPNGIIGYIKNYGSYTWYFFENIIKLKNNAEASVLYEYINKYKHQKDFIEVDGKCQFEIAIPLTKLRQILAPTAYPIVSDFCRYALKPAIKAINKNTTMQIELLGSVKKGRNIDAYLLGVSVSDAELDLRSAFKVERNKKAIMNEDQRIKFGMLLVSDEIYCAYQPQMEGESVAMYMTRIRNLLKDNDYVESIYLPFLKPTGYRNKRLDLKMAQIEMKDVVPEQIDPEFG